MDTTPTPNSPATPAGDSAVQAVAQDALDALALGKQIMAAYKKSGATGAAALLPQVVAAAEKDFVDVSAALPSIKAGWKTTEFWAPVVVTLVGGGYYLATGKDVPVNLTVLAGSLLSIYGVARTMLKAAALAKTPAAPAK